MSPGKGNELLLLALLLLALFSFDAASFRTGHAWGDDFSQYIVQAQGLVDGALGETLEASRYRYDNSENKLIGPVLYPWGFPLLLSPVYSLYGMNIQAMKLYTSLFFLFSLGILFFLFRGRLSTAQNFLIILMMGIDPVFFEAKNDVLSDFPFMFFCLLTLLMIQRSVVERRRVTGVWGDNALIGAGMFLSYAVRANGIILLPTLLLVQLAQGRTSFMNPCPKASKAMPHLIPYAVFIILVCVLNSVLPSSSSSYMDQLSGMGMQSIIRNILLYGVMPVDFFTASMGPVLSAVGKILFLISFPALYLGLIRTGREHFLFFIFPALFMALLILWPGIQGPRYIFPVIPFYLFFLFQGLNEAASSIALPFLKGRPILRPAMLFGSLSVIIFGMAVSAQAYHTLTHPGEVQDGPFAADSTALFSYIAHNTRQRDVIIFYKPRAIWLFTRRKAIRLTRIEDIMVSRAKYIACRKDDSVDTALNRKIWIARKVYANDSFSLYARMRLSTVHLPLVPEASARTIAPAPKGAGHAPVKKQAASRKKKKEHGKEPRKRRSYALYIHV